MTDRIPVLRSLVLLLVVGSLLAACGDDGGPDLIAALSSLPGRTDAPPAGASGSGSHPLEGAEGLRWFEGDVNSVASDFRSEAGQPEDTVTEDGVIHYLYRSGTVIIADVGGTTGAGLFDNDRVRRNRPALAGNSGWNRRVNDFRSSGSSSGNGFRGGGSGSGK